MSKGTLVGKAPIVTEAGSGARLLLPPEDCQYHRA
jgi:hypothetical protein